MKQCKTDNFREKEVVNIADGKILGRVSEVEFDVCTGKITAIIVKGECGFFGKGKRDFVIPWCNIEKIGEDIILVRVDGGLPSPPSSCDCEGDRRKGHLEM